MTDSAEAFEAQRRRLPGLACRLPGAASGAEDVVQDATFAQFLAERFGHGAASRGSA